jgi:SAM-dependent methyltransferase
MDQAGSPSRLEQALIARLAHAPGTLNTTIHPEDDVYRYAVTVHGSPAQARLVYLRQGADMLETVRQLAAWKFGGLDRVESVLDFACGYGRLTRHLVQEVEPGRVWVSDIDAQAVAFQERQFGVHGFVSVTEPRALRAGHRFDLIFVASLFTHLPEHRFGPWLTALHRLLTPRGLLAFSVNDEAGAPALSRKAGGFHFRPHSESHSLPVREYGGTWVSEAYVRAALRRRVGWGWTYCRVERGLCSYQDLYLATRRRWQDFSGFRYRRPLAGVVDERTLTPANELHLTGWAGDPNEGRTVREVQVLLNGVEVGRCPVNGARPDVAAALGLPKLAASGWECRLPLQGPPARGEDVVEVWAVSDGGTAGLIFLGPVREAPEAGAA